MAPRYVDNDLVSSLLPMQACIDVMDRMFRSLAAGECIQPLRSLMRVPDKNGLLGMMPGYAGAPGILGIKLITIFHGNGTLGIPSHQGVIVLLDPGTGTPLLLLDATAITAIRTAAASALATRLLSREDAGHLAILGTGEQAQKHVEAISLVRKLRQITIWGRNETHAESLVQKLRGIYDLPIDISPTARLAVHKADIICSVTASPQPILKGDWIPSGAHINAVGSCTPSTRELDTKAVLRSRLFTDRYESLFNEAGEFLIPKKEGLITETDVQGELGEVLCGSKPGRRDAKEITLFKSLGIAAEDLFSARFIYDELNK
jgi:ornithine cyclodeaminase/alanine dehydrogenase-like protein (mu-crystallin family)